MLLAVDLIMWFVYFLSYSQMRCLCLTLRENSVVTCASPQFAPTGVMFFSLLSYDVKCPAGSCDLEDITHMPDAFARLYEDLQTETLTILPGICGGRRH